jgi:hypothetical protein
MTDIEIKDESWTLSGPDPGSEYEVMFSTRGFRVAARILPEKFKMPDGREYSAVRVRIQCDAPTFKEDDKMPMPFAPRSPTHASATVPGGLFPPALHTALNWCLAKRQENELNALAAKGGDLGAD